ncbi:MAG: PorT family protein [Lewinellaceae bacterium]|nr:PorT family protein [Lewinellaceae bacterium]
MRTRTLCCIFFTVLSASTLQAQYRFGLKAGFQLANMHYQGADNPFVYTAVLQQKESDPRLSFAVGAILLYDLKKNLTLSAEVQLGGRGYHREDLNATQDFQSFDAWLWDLQVPLACNFRWRGFTIGAGPYAALGLGGKVKTVSPNRQEFSENVRFGNDEPSQYRRFDAGLYSQIGYSFRNFRLMLSYQLGLTNTIPTFYTESADASAKQRIANLSAAYFFGVRE